MNRKNFAWACYTLSAISMFSILIIPAIAFPSMFIFLIIGMYNMHVYQKEHHNKAMNYINEFKSKGNYDDFNTTFDGLQGIFLELDKSRIGLLKRDNLDKEFEVEHITFSDISDVHVIKNESTVIKSSKSDLIGKSLVGGMVAGGFGAVVGAVGSDKKLDGTLTKLTLQIVVDDILNPIRNITILNFPEGQHQANITRDVTTDIADKWFKRITLIIKNKENENRKIV